MKRTITSLLALTLYTVALFSTACTQDQLQSFKNEYNAGANAFAALSSTLTALAAQGKLGTTTAADIQQFSNLVTQGKTVVNGLTAFPPANSAELRALLTSLISQLNTFLQNAGGNPVLIAALAAGIAFLQTSQDMLPPTIAAHTRTTQPGATVDVTAQLADLKVKRKALQEAVSKLR